MRPIPAALALAALALVAAATAPLPREEATFHLVRGGDTIATERFTRTADRLQAELSASNGSRVRYTADLAPDATVRRVEIWAYPPGSAADAPAAQHATAELRGDSVFGTVTEGGSQRADRGTTTPGAIPYINPSPSMMEQIVRRARVLGGDSTRVPIMVVGQGQTVEVMVRRVGADSATLMLGPVEVRLRTDAAGSLLGGSVPSQELRIERRP